MDEPGEGHHRTDDRWTPPGDSARADSRFNPGTPATTPISPPPQRTREKGGKFTESIPEASKPHFTGTTLVLPYVGGRVAKRTRRLRAWMISLPADFLALLAPLLWTTHNWKGLVSNAVLAVALFAAGGLYRGMRHLSILDLLPALLGRLLIAAAIVAIVAAQRHDSIAYAGEFMHVVALAAAIVVLGRVLTTTAVLIARRRRWVEHATIIIGGGPIATELARLIRRYPQYGLRFVGFVDDPSAQEGPGDLTKYVGTANVLEAIIPAVDCDVIIVADTATPEPKVIDIVRQPNAMKCDLWIVPRLCDFNSHSGHLDHIGAIPITRLRRATLTGPKWAFKRASDVVLAMLALAIVSPVMLVCALAVRLDGGPGVIFRQQRIGRHGVPFEVLKFRSIQPVDDEESQTTWSVAKDPRVGPVGRFLRRTSLDELPQLWNILRGDMTFVGPRPERPYFVEKFSAEHPTYTLRHRVPVGLTGLAQVSGLRGDTPISDRARYDNYYIDNWSPWLDIKVLLRTFGEVFRASGR
jgi:exopolysaccharide biosynthesis polyprenyl glycosylphosphotransferase